MKRVLLLAQYNCQGAERMTVLYAKILFQYDYDCEILQAGRIGEKNDLLPFIPSCIKRFEYRYKHYRDFLIYLAKFLKEHNYDLIFCSLPTMGSQVCFIKKLLCLKSKIIVRFCNNPNMGNTISHIQNRIFLRFADVIIAQTKEMKELIEDYYTFLKGKCLVINNPIDKDLIIESIKETFEMDRSYVNYISVGKVIERKGFDTLITAFNQLLLKQPNSRLYIVGDYESRNCIEYKELLNTMIDDYKIKDKIFFLGFQKNPFKFVAGADVFVLASKEEGLPNVLLEAFYLGKPVVATQSVPYVAQVVQNGVNGFSVPVGDVIAMADCMLKAKEIHIEKYTDINNSERLVVRTFQQPFKE